MSIYQAFIPAEARSRIDANRIVLLDIFERVLVVAMFAHFCVLMVAAYEMRQQIGTLLIIISESATIVMIMTRRFSTTLSQYPLDWLLAVAGCCAPLLAIPGEPSSQSAAQIGAGIMIMGFCLQISAKVILFRSFGIVAANRGVKDKGPYRFMRHPMYAGYVLSHFGYLIGWPSTHNIMLYTLALIIQMARLLREEEILMQDSMYREYAARVRYRLLPGVF